MPGLIWNMMNEHVRGQVPSGGERGDHSRRQNNNLAGDRFLFGASDGGKESGSCRLGGAGHDGRDHSVRRCSGHWSPGPTSSVSNRPALRPHPVPGFSICCSAVASSEPRPSREAFCFAGSRSGASPRMSRICHAAICPLTARSGQKRAAKISRKISVRHLLPSIPTPGPEEPGPFSWADPARVHRILEGAGFSEVSLTPLDPVIQLAGPAGEAEAADFVMAMGPLARVLPSPSAAQRENVRATLEVYFKGHATSQGVVLPAANWVVRARV